jgi:fluoroacetyl-CoA thioesterase
MKTIFHKGDQKVFKRVVTKNDVAQFESGTVHNVYSTFAIARDAEWSGRLFVLGMKDEDEVGIGTFISVEHLSSALVGEEIIFIYTLNFYSENEIKTTFEAKVNERLIAVGEQRQKILKKERLERIFSGLQQQKNGR